MEWNVLFILLMIVCSNVLCGIQRSKSSNQCFAEISCDGETKSSENLSIVVEGLPGPHGLAGATGNNKNKIYSLFYLFFKVHPALSADEVYLVLLVRIKSLVTDYTDELF
jgi:hypothetical protein